MTVRLPLRLQDTSDFQEMSSTDENFLAYHTGLAFAQYDSADIGAIGFLNSGSSTDRLIGSIANTAYDSAVGTGGGSSLLSITTTTTNLYQQKGAVGSSHDSDYRLPLFTMDSSSQITIKEFQDSDTQALGSRLASRIFLSDYPGTYKLGSSAPDGTYSVALANVMTDTRTGDSAGDPNVVYNIYQKKSMSAPSTAIPFSIKRSSGGSGTYQGVQLMQIIAICVYLQIGMDLLQHNLIYW